MMESNADADVEAEEYIAASQIIVQENAKEARMQARADLLTHLGKLMNAPDPRDFVFVCKDGVRLKACRMFFTGRSPVFDTMLTNGMLESKSSVVTLLEVPAPALISIMEYLYTGDIVANKPKDWEAGLEIISAAHFFLLPTIDRIVEEFNMAQIPSVDEDLRQAATMLSLALTFKCLSPDERETLWQLVCLLKSRWMQSDYAGYLSEEAVAFILKRTKLDLEAKDSLHVSLGEYFRFRGVLAWSIFNGRFAFTEEVQKLFNVALPLANKHLYVKGVKDLSSLEVKWLPKYDGDSALDEIVQFLQSHEARDSAMRLLAHIDLVRMPPILLVKFVEPMMLLPEPRLMDIFRCHSLRRAMSVELRWVHNESYAVYDDGFGIQKNGRSPGSAICQLANRVSDDSCTWRFSPGNVHFSFCQMGFVCSEGQANPCRTWNFEQDCVEAAIDSRTTVSRVVQCYTNSGTIEFSGHGSNFMDRPRCVVNPVKTVEFQYNRSRRSCDIVINDTALGTVWTNLPTTNIFPAVSLGQNNPKAWVALEVVSGFDIF